MSHPVDVAARFGRRSVMTALLISCAALAALLLALQPGADLALAGGGVNPKGGSYKGPTAQGKQVSFSVGNDTVRTPKFTIRSGPCTGTFTIFASDNVNNSGSFLIRGSGDTLFRGRFVSNTKVKGTATAEFLGCPGGTKTVAYTARRQ